MSVPSDDKTQTDEKQPLTLEPTTWWVPKDPALENRLVLVLAKMVRFALLQQKGENQSRQLHLQPISDVVPVIGPSCASVSKEKGKHVSKKQGKDKERKQNRPLDN